MDNIYIRIENDQDRPPAISWNTGYKESKGDFIIFIIEISRPMQNK